MSMFINLFLLENWALSRRILHLLSKIWFSIIDMIELNSHINRIETHNNLKGNNYIVLLVSDHEKYY